MSIWAADDGMRFRQPKISFILKQKKMDFTENTFNRLSLALIEKKDCSAEDALAQLNSFRIYLNCGEAIRSSLPLQAAFITAVNTASRAFLGGVFVNLPMNVPCLLPWPEKGMLNDVAIELGAQPVDENTNYVLTLNFGLPGNIDDNKVEVFATNWCGGIFVEGESATYQCTSSLPLGGIYAGALAVGLAFLKTSNIQPHALDKSTGLSLWLVYEDWLSPKAEGPAAPEVPSKIWILGLGHLGQAYLWALGLMPFYQPKQVDLYLQDTEKVVDANLSAGLLCTEVDIDYYKTRVCARWLSKRGFGYHLVERKFNSRTFREGDEPYVALCGFDNAPSRRVLEKAGFDLVIEAGLGATLDNFDKIMMHIFPSKIQQAEMVWADLPATLLPNEKVLNALTRFSKEQCGILELSIAGKAVSSSFVGACAGALVIAEVVKARNGGKKTDKLVTQLRVPGGTKTAAEGIYYTTEIGKNSCQITAVRQTEV